MSTDDPQNKMILATGGYDHTIHFWLAHSGVRSFSVQHPSSVSLCLISFYIHLSNQGFLLRGQICEK